MQKTLYFNPDNETALQDFSLNLFRFIQKTKKDNQSIVLVCIGTDRATGDCLGPLVGHYLNNYLFKEKICIYGNLANPVHAINLEETIHAIHTEYTSPYIIVVDACLGSTDHIGYVTLSNRPLHPGKGVNKKLPPLGNISITGIVNHYDPYCESLIQTTRLHQVMSLATFISNGIKDLVSYHHL